MTSPLQRYKADLESEGFSHDPAQEQAVLLLEDLYGRLVARQRAPKGGLGALLGKWRRGLPEPEVGLYLWGGVGRGKTYLVDTFYDCIPYPKKFILSPQ